MVNAVETAVKLKYQASAWNWRLFLHFLKVCEHLKLY